MGLYTGTRITTRDIEKRCAERVKEIVTRLMVGAIDPPDGARMLTDLILRTASAMTRASSREEPQP